MEIIEVQNKRDLKEFLNLPDKIYTDPQTKYVRPLDAHMNMIMGKLGTPQKHFLLAKENGQTIARLGAKVHTHHGKKTLNFGFFECVEGHPEAAKLLIEHAHQKYPELKMMGPYHFRMEDPYIGVLKEGFDRNPSFLMSYNPPYYVEYLESTGLKLAMDLFTYEVDSAVPLGDNIYQNAQRARDSGVTLRSVNRKKLNQEARKIAMIFNDALSDNWGFEEFIDSQVKEMVLMFKFFLDTRVILIAEKDGKTVGCLIMLPDYNPLIKPLNGKLSLGFIFKYFKRFKLINKLRGYALGVKKEAHGLGIGSLLVEEMFKLAPTYGYPTGEVSWVLASNGPMNELSKAMKGKHDKVYRIYTKDPVK